MISVEDRLKKKISGEEYELALQLLRLSPSRIRVFIEEITEKAAK
jgi:hypothetical protein